MQDQKRNPLKDLGFKINTKADRFSALGKTYSVTNDLVDRYFWLYESENFTINVYDFFVKEDIVLMHVNDKSKNEEGLRLAFLKHAYGEIISPYTTLENDMLFTHFEPKNPFRFLLHQGFPFLAVAVSYNENFWKTQIPESIKVGPAEIREAAGAVNGVKYTSSISEIVGKLLVQYEDPDKIDQDFFDQRVQSLIKGIVTDYFEDIEKKKNIAPEDIESLNAVKNYIDDHYASDLSQDLLCKIACMGRTKLKNTFKERFGMTITEYIQRKRINVAEHLLISSQMKIADVSRSIGYTSHSRFSELFKKYKGIGPKDFQLRLRK